MITHAPITSKTSPGDAALAITGRDYLSWSQINSFRGCPRAFAFKYVEKAEPAFVSTALLFGGAIHSAIQHHHEVRFTGETATLDDLVEAYRLAWHERVQELGDVPVRYGAGETADTLLAMARGLLECFLDSELASPAGELIAIEEKLRGTIADDLPDVLAIIDLGYVADDGLHVVDYKTSRSKWSDAKVNESSEQLKLYRALAKELVDPDTPVHLHFGVLVKTKTPQAQQMDVAPAKGEGTEALASAIRPVWRAMQLGIDFAAPSAMGCGGCPFKKMCPAYAVG